MSNMIQGSTHAPSALGSDRVDEAEIQQINDKISTLENLVSKINSDIDSAAKQIRNAQKMMEQHVLSQNTSAAKSETVVTTQGVAPTNNLIADEREINQGIEQMLAAFPKMIDGDKSAQQQYDEASSRVDSTIRRYTDNGRRNIPSDLKIPLWNKLNDLILIKFDLNDIKRNQDEVKKNLNQPDSSKPMSDLEPARSVNDVPEASNTAVDPHSDEEKAFNDVLQQFGLDTQNFGQGTNTPVDPEPFKTNGQDYQVDFNDTDSSEETFFHNAIIDRTNKDYTDIQDALEDLNDPQITASVNKALQNYYIPSRDGNKAP